MSCARPLHMVQVCNVPQICGGTAACAWSIARAFPDMRQTVIFPGEVPDETVQAFADCRIVSRNHLIQSGWRVVGGDVVILHNPPPDILPEPVAPVTLSYHHSAGARMSAPLSAACSRWLADRQPGQLPVLYQPVPRPLMRTGASQRMLDDELIVGRLCTPQRRKWPEELCDFYHELALRCPRVRWEFVGCPDELQQTLRLACGQRCRFLNAGHQARGHLTRWHALLYHHPKLTESFGRTVAEAMRAGCIPIVDDRGGFREQIEAGATGFLCGAPSDFEAALETIQEGAIRWQLSMAARLHADEQFSLRTFRRRLIDMFTSARCIDG